MFHEMYTIVIPIHLLCLGLVPRILFDVESIVSGIFREGLGSIHALLNPSSTLAWLLSKVVKYPGLQPSKFLETTALVYFLEQGPKAHGWASVTLLAYTLCNVKPGMQVSGYTQLEFLTEPRAPARMVIQKSSLSYSSSGSRARYRRLARSCSRPPSPSGSAYPVPPKKLKATGKKTRACSAAHTINASHILK